MIWDDIIRNISTPNVVCFHLLFLFVYFHNSFDLKMIYQVWINTYILNKPILVKLGKGGLVLGSGQFSPLPQLPQNIMLATNMAKSSSKITNHLAYLVEIFNTLSGFSNSGTRETLNKILRIALKRWKIDIPFSSKLSKIRVFETPVDHFILYIFLKLEIFKKANFNKLHIQT